MRYRLDRQKLRGETVLQKQVCFYVLFPRRYRRLKSKIMATKNRLIWWDQLHNRDFAR
jgi:hypothetical protein